MHPSVAGDTILPMPSLQQHVHGTGLCLYAAGSLLSDHLPSLFRASAGPPATPKGPGGMDLRDWFAGMAMQPILTSIDESFQRTWDSRSLTKDAYDLADAMLEARGPEV